MAKEKKDQDAGDGGSGKGGATNLVLIIAAALISLGLGAGGAFFFASSRVPPPASPQPSAAEMAQAEAAEAQKSGTEDFKERLYGLDPFVVNVTGDGYNRFLKLRVELETSDPGVKEELDARLPQVRDALIVLLSSKKLSDITDYEGKALLKEDMLDRVNDVLERGSVRSILFTEFVVQ